MTTGNPTGPTEPDTSDVPEAPAEPDGPAAPAAPATPDGHDPPTAPGAATQPEAPATPAEPGSPAAPDGHEPPTAPGAATAPEAPATPAEPDAPQEPGPAEPGNPAAPDSPAERPVPAAAWRPPRGRFSLRRRVRVASAIAVVVAVLLAAAGTIAFASLLEARDALVDRADPGLQDASELLAAMVDQETGLRAYVLSGDETFLEPYEQGAGAAEAARAGLDRRVGDLPGVAPRLDEVDRAIAAWRDDYAEPTIEEVQAGDPAVREEALLREGRERFDDVRARIADLQDRLTAERADAHDQLNATTTRLLAILVVAALTVAAIAALLWRLVRRRVEVPLLHLGRDAQQVAGGDLDHLIEPVGPDEMQALAASMEQMRRRIVDELEAVRQARDALERRSGDLARSNTELEQFAYVASHDLQEPLRKVASFCQLLQTRYAGRLDDRADQYIGFAVDGARRMQALINDLLAFSRVGRSPTDAVVVRAGQLVDEALENLAPTIEESGAEITVIGPLPRVRVEASLGVALFQNLISNGLKFHRPDAPPSVEVTSRHAAGFHEFAVRDEGIGIPAEYAERIFVIFQRLHARDDYGGTGIGLALSRKIVEGHGGRIWVDTGPPADGAPGTTIRFTLPVLEGDA
jgi:signal transduction histidine kinase